MARGGKKYNDPSIKHVDTDTWYRIRQRLTTVKILCSDGATNGQIADYLGVSIYTIVTYRQRYPEFDACFLQGRQDVVEKLEGKMYQLAMGTVDTNVVRSTVKEVTEEVEDAETGVVKEVVKTKKYRDSVTEVGVGTPDINAIQFLLKNLDPAKYNVQPDKKDVVVEPVSIVDTIKEEVVGDEPVLFYDDTQDETTIEEVHKDEE